jgi:hypothetical protein
MPQGEDHGIGELLCRYIADADRRILIQDMVRCSLRKMALAEACLGQQKKGILVARPPACQSQCSSVGKIVAHTNDKFVKGKAFVENGYRVLRV